jgi:cobyrinic acid a,c-diamide synthase
MDTKNTITVPRILLAGANSKESLTMVGIGLAAQLRRQGLGVSCCVVGPHFQLALLLKRLTGRPVPCLDSLLLSPQQMLAELYLASLGADLVLIVGGKGLFDSETPGGLGGCAGELAQMIKAPVILAADPQGFGNGFAALIKGYAEFLSGCQVAGVLITKVEAEENAAHATTAFYEECLSAYDLPPLIGVLPDAAGAEVTEPACGICQRRNYTAIPREFFVDLANNVFDHINMDKLVELAGKAQVLDTGGFTAQPLGRRTRIAVADDVCFGLCFQNNLLLLRYYGAELVSFSPLADQRLPRDLGGIYLTGGFLMEYGKELEMNKDIVKAIREFADKGGLIYSEGSGTAYLCRKFQLEEKGEWAEGVGLIPGLAWAQTPKQYYIEVAGIDESIIGKQGCEVRGVDSGEWEVQSSEALVRTVEITRKGKSPFSDGYSPGAQMFCTCAFLNMASNPEIAASLVDAAEVEKKIGKEKTPTA